MAWFLKRPRRPPQRDHYVKASLPAPVGGINLIDPPQALGPMEAPSVSNIIANSNGLVTRAGTRSWATGVGSGTDAVRTLMSFNGGTSSDSMLFAVCQTGIYDITTTGAAAQELAFASTAGLAGFGVPHSFTTIAGEFMLYCDEVNGYHLYTQSSDTWAAVAQGAAAGQISGVDPATLVFVTSWKNRVWFVEKSTASAWYLPVGQVTGAVTEFNFGSRFRKGGELAGLWSWTLDGGAGVDDHLVAISTAGELLIFAGTDPDAVDAFNLIGSWDLGSVPGGRRIAYNYNGDLFVYTQQGLVSVSKLRGGLGLDQAAAWSRKIQPVITSLFTTDTTNGWYFFAEVPIDRTLLVHAGSTSQITNYALSKDSGGWSEIAWYLSQSGPFCAVVHQGTLYWGLSNQEVHRSIAGNDDQASDGSGGTAVTWGFVSGPVVRDFTVHKIISQAKGRFVGTAPTHGFAAKYEFSTSSTGAVTSGASANYWNGVSPATGQASSGREAYIIMAGSGTGTIAGVDVLLTVEQDQ